MGPSGPASKLIGFGLAVSGPGMTGVVIAVGAAGFSSAAGCWASWANGPPTPTVSSAPANATTETQRFFILFMFNEASRPMYFCTISAKQPPYQSPLACGMATDAGAKPWLCADAPSAVLVLNFCAYQWLSVET